MNSCPGCGWSLRSTSFKVHVNKCPWLITVDQFLDFGKVASRGESECWIWKPDTNQGYGDFGSDRAHRQAYRVAYNIEPGELYVCHRCDNPPCVNPDHLFLGTSSDNTMDAVRKGRVVSPMLNPEIKARASLSLPRGDQHHMRKNPELARLRVQQMLAGRNLNKKENDA